MVMLDDTRCGLDASSLHRDTSMINYNAKKFGLLSCNRDTYSTAREKAKQKLRNHLPSFLYHLQIYEMRRFRRFMLFIL